MPDNGSFLGFDHIHFWVGNAFQAAAYYICRFGFQPLAYRSLETGSRAVMTQVIRQGSIIFAFSSPLDPAAPSVISDHTSRHGDGVKDVAFTVSDCHAVFARAIAAGSVKVSEPETHSGPDGECIIATVEAPYPDTWHTFVQRSSYTGIFLPGYVAAVDHDPQVDLVEPAGLELVDHCVANQPEGDMQPVVQWYIDALCFHRFWSVDDTQMHTEFSALRSVVVADYNERVKMPINEPAAGRRKSQIQEFVDYYSGAGIQHIALRTQDIINAITRLRQRGLSFIRVPVTYYEDLRKRLKSSAVTVQEDLDRIEKLGILIDFDETGYLLQIFTKPVQDRPTLFIEVIQRCNNQGFGAGNFKSLFEAIEREQALRGNL